MTRRSRRRTGPPELGTPEAQAQARRWFAEQTDADHADAVERRSPSYRYTLDDAYERDESDATAGYCDPWDRLD